MSERIGLSINREQLGVLGYGSPINQEGRVGVASRNQCTSFFEPFLNRIDQEEVVAAGVKLVIPRYHLYGTQPKEQYSNQKLRTVRGRFAKCGAECLRRNPVYVCFLPAGDQSTLAIIDGHHRARESGNIKEDGKKIIGIPSVVLTLEQTVNFINRTLQPNEVVYTPDTLRMKLYFDVASALATFQEMDRAKQPKPLCGITRLIELCTAFPSF